MAVYIGIDWSEEKHDVVFLNEQGAILGQLTVPPSPEGLHNLEKAREYLGLSRDECLVALETAHNLIIDFLWDQGYRQVYVIPPSVIKSCRGRYGNSGARDDQTDGQLIADTLRTDLKPSPCNTAIGSPNGCRVALPTYNIRNRKPGRRRCGSIKTKCPCWPRCYCNYSRPNGRA